MATPAGRHLAALAGLWLAGRAGMLAHGPVTAAIDMAFLPLAAWPLYRILHRSGNRRNMFVIVLLAALAACNAAFHAALLGLAAVPPATAMHAALMIVVLLESVIAGRVIPGFTANAAGVRTTGHAWRDRACVVMTAAAGAAWIAGLPAPVVIVAASAAACLQLLRLAGWQPRSTVRIPLLWILHLSYAWIAAGFVLLALGTAGLVPQSAAVHALAVGATGGLIVGMITRTALGHTGRPLRAGRSETAMYAMIEIAALSRLAAEVAPVALREGALILAAAAWCGAFGLYAAVYAPRLLRPRVDGKAE
jgi:uncharacterized protein involved in response to NO